MTAFPTPVNVDVLGRRHSTLSIAEAFGPTIQGEGPAAGRRAWFVRLGHCNLSCSWCDTPYTWDTTRYDLKAELQQVDVMALAGQIPNGALVVFTGGEPLIQQGRPGWEQLLRTLRARACQLHVETNGTLSPNAATRHGIETFVVSPKLANAGPHRPGQDPALHHDWTSIAYTGHAHLKVVCSTAGDVEDAVTLADRYRWPYRQVWVMPEGSTPERLAATWPTVAATAAELGVNASHRLHVLAWGDQRGH
jgi:organic radical activating enzyme